MKLSSFSYMRYYPILLIFLLPLALAYDIGDYTGGDVFIQPGQEVNLVLPFPKGNNCLPVAVLFLEGGKDYPTVYINGRMFIGGGMKRTVLEGNVVRITLSSSAPAMLDGNSMIYCTRDPFVFLEYRPEQQIKVGNYNYVSIILKNAGYSEANVHLTLAFHPDIAPYLPVIEDVRVPPRSVVSYTMFAVAAPYLLIPSAYPSVCMDYNDSIMKVHVCKLPVPAAIVIKPLVICVNDECINSSNVEIGGKERVWKVGEVLSSSELAEFNGIEVKKIGFATEKGYAPFEINGKTLGLVLVILGLLYMVLLTAGFI